MFAQNLNLDGGSSYLHLLPKKSSSELSQEKYCISQMNSIYLDQMFCLTKFNISKKNSIFPFFQRRNNDLTMLCSKQHLKCNKCMHSRSPFCKCLLVFQTIFFSIYTAFQGNTYENKTNSTAFFSHYHIALFEWMCNFS